MDVKEKVKKLLEYKKKQLTDNIRYSQEKYLEGYIQALNDVLDVID